jgi:hypothetical protein
LITEWNIFNYEFVGRPRFNPIQVVVVVVVVVAAAAAAGIA